jgi:hypothetical protein
MGLKWRVVIFMLSRHGLWGSHLWVSTTAHGINGGSAFLVKMNTNTVVVRSYEVFQTLEVDIVAQPRPQNQVSIRDYRNLEQIYIYGCIGNFRAVHISMDLNSTVLNPDWTMN